MRTFTHTDLIGQYVPGTRWKVDERLIVHTMELFPGAWRFRNASKIHTDWIEIVNEVRGGVNGDEYYVPCDRRIALIAQGKGEEPCNQYRTIPGCPTPIECAGVRLYFRWAYSGYSSAVCLHILSVLFNIPVKYYKRARRTGL